MTRKLTTLALAGFMTFGLVGTAGAVGNLNQGTSPISVERVKDILMAQRRSCKAVSTCEEAVEMWCGGYSRADGDDDGIPCENVCRSLSQVEAIKKKVGC
jgi:hypothetical protein